MEKFKVNIETRLGYYIATANRGRHMLCRFNKSCTGDGWYFLQLPAGTGRGVSIQNEDNPGQFPLTYFLNLCRSMLFLEYGTGEMPEVELTVAAKKLLGVK